MSAPRRKKITINILMPFIVFVLFFSIMIWQKYRSSQAVPHTLPQAGTESIRSVVLYFAVDGSRLVSEPRVLDPCDDDTACLKSVLDELLSGPVGDLDETIPDGVVISSVRIEGNQATIEFNQLFLEAMPSGSAAEMLAVYSVVNTTAANFPQIQRVKIEVDGNKTGILRHLDISEPLTPDYTLEISPPHEAEKELVQPSINNKGEHR
jgi:spore germination protein GerM